MTLTGLVDDLAMMLVVVVLLFIPLAVLAAGAPVVLPVRLIIEVAQRL